MIIIALVIQFPENVFATTTKEAQLNAQKQALLDQQNAAKAQAAQKAKDAAAFQSQIDTATSQINATQSALTTTEGQIGETQKNISDLEDQIAVQEDNLNQEKGKLNDVAASWYMEEQSGLLEAVLTSESLSEMMDKQQYYDSVKQQVLAQMEKINKMKDDLNSQKQTQTDKQNQLVDLQNQQTAYKKSVEIQKAQKDKLLTMTLAQKTAYLNQAQQIQGEIDSVSAEIYAERAKARKGNEQWIYGTTSYPYTNPNAIDQWGFYQMQCTSYAAWYWNVKLGRDWYRGDGPSGTGDAANWPSLAARNGVSVHSSPKVGAIISWQRSSLMPYGHVAIVEAVNSDGTIDLSEMNWVKYTYSYRKNVNPSYYGGYSYIY